MTKDEIEHRFSWHECDAEQVAKMAIIRQASKDFALLIAELTPVSREQSQAFSYLKNTVYCSNDAIAMYGK